MVPEQPAPAAAAREEAAKQAVALAFGLTGALILMIVQRRMLKDMMPGAAADELASAAEREKRWHQAMVWLVRIDLIGPARWCARKADAARRDYDRARP